jgi:hypothetical protein
MKTILLLAIVLGACSGVDGGDDNIEELISTVQLTFMPPSGLPIVAEFDDPDGDGGNPGTSEPINLAAGASYTLTVAFINRLGTIPEDITLEVRDEGTAHQVFFTGTAVNSPATSNTSAPLTQSYADMDANGLPLGLTNMITTAAGTGQLTVTLRHMPPELPPEKSADTATVVKNGGFDAIGGSTDASVNFDVTVQ